MLVHSKIEWDVLSWELSPTVTQQKKSCMNLNKICKILYSIR